MKDCSFYTQHQNKYVYWTLHLSDLIQYSVQQQEFICHLNCYVRSWFADAAMIVVHRSNFHCFPGGIFFCRTIRLGLEYTCQKHFITFQLIKYYK